MAGCFKFLLETYHGKISAQVRLSIAPECICPYALAVIGPLNDRCEVLAGSGIKSLKIIAAVVDAPVVFNSKA